MQTENNLLLDIKDYADSDYSAESNLRYKYFLVIAPQQMISVVADEQINRIVSLKHIPISRHRFRYGLQ